MLLATAEVSLEDSTGGFHRGRALIDPGSEVNLVTSSLARRLGMPLRNSQMSLRVVGGSTSCTASQTTTLQLRPINSDDSPLPLTAFLLPKLGITSPRFQGERKTWPHLNSIELADVTFMNPQKIDILLGAEAYARILKDGIRRGPPGTPTAQNTSMGWIVFGAIKPPSLADAWVLASSTSSLDSLEQTLKKFWELEDVSGPALLSADDRECERLFVEGYKRAPSGRYIVRLPFKRVLSLDAEGTLAIAKGSLKHTLARMQKDPEFAREYHTFMREYYELGHMRIV